MARIQVGDYKQLVASSSMAKSADLLHRMLLFALDNELYTSPPVPPSGTILDVGTGTGTWACELAERNPGCRVYGIDLHQVTPAKVPQNVVFETVDVMTGFPFNTGTFDFVHSRLLVGGITNWDSYLANLFRITKRGGYTECTEIELDLCCNNNNNLKATHAWTSRMEETLKQFDLEPAISLRLKDKMKAAGFSDVQDKVLDVPIGEWQKGQEQAGREALDYCRIHIVAWYEDILVKRGESLEQASQTAKAVMSELIAHGAQPFFRWHFCTGRKSD